MVSTRYFPGQVFDDFDCRFNSGGYPDMSLHLCPNCEGHCFMDYIAAWVEHGNGALVCAGNFELYQTAIICLMAAWRDDPTFLDLEASDIDDDVPAITRGVTSVHTRDKSCWVHEAEVGWNHRAFDAQWFATVAFNKTHPSL